jgi:4a-hydroxytetrahydrobiopterin dehydratase
MSQETSEWQEIGQALHKTFYFKGFLDAIVFMNQAAGSIEALHHHPEWTNVYNRVTIRLTTHDAGHTITPKDHQLAQVLDRHYEAMVGD